MHTYFNPVKVYLGVGAVLKLKKILKKISNVKNILVIEWDKSIEENKDIKNIIESEVNYNWHFINFNISNPTTDDLFKLYENTKDLGIDLIVAIGGGSVLDVAKSLCCLYGNTISTQDELLEGIKNKIYLSAHCPWIGVPTTAGTGSEVTCWATIWNPKENTKLSIENNENYAYAALVDPQFASTMPKALVVSSAFDALAHATEAFWAKGTNTISKALALRAVSTIMNHIEEIFEAGTEEKAQEYLAEGSLLAGMAFSNTKTTACHSLSYPLTLNYSIPHGIAVGMLIAPIMKVNSKVVADIEDLYQAYGVSGFSEIQERIEKIMNRVNIPCKLRDWGVEKNDINFLVLNAGTKGRLDNNPVELTTIQIEEVLESIL